MDALLPTDAGAGIAGAQVPDLRPHGSRVSLTAAFHPAARRQTVPHARRGTT